MIRNQFFFDDKLGLKELEFLQNPSNILSKFGLSPNQSKLYLHLIKIGPKPASQLSKTLNIPRTETYHLIKILKQKGCLISLNEKPMKFLAVPINDFLEKIILLEEQKIQRLRNTLDMIKKLKLANSFEFSPKNIS